MSRATREPPRARSRAPVTDAELDEWAGTPIPDEQGDVREVGLFTKIVRSVVPAAHRDAAQRALDQAISTHGSNASIVTVVGSGGILLSVLYALLHGFFGWFPERAQVESRSELRRVEAKLSETEAELARVQQLLFELSRQDGCDGDASGGEAQ